MFIFDILVAYVESLSLAHDDDRVLGSCQLCFCFLLFLFLFDCCQTFLLTPICFTIFCLKAAQCHTTVLCFINDFLMTFLIICLIASVHKFENFLCILQHSGGN